MGKYRRGQMKRMFIGLALVAAAFGASAACECRCSNGQNQAFCTSPLDIRPICAPMICPIVPPSIAPIQMPTIPPIGTTNCSQQQVLNPYTGQYQWQTVCR